MHLHKKIVYTYLSPNSNTTIDFVSSNLYTNVIICKLKKFGARDVTNEDENRKIATEALMKLDEVKNFIGVKGSDHLNMIFIVLIKNVEQMTLKK